MKFLNNVKIISQLTLFSTFLHHPRYYRVSLRKFSCKLFNFFYTLEFFTVPFKQYLNARACPRDARFFAIQIATEYFIISLAMHPEPQLQAVQDRP